MAGTKIGGLRAAQTNKQKYGPDFYQRLGHVGGRASNNGGFGSPKVGKDGLTGRERASEAGAKGGSTSRRQKYLAKPKAAQLEEERDKQPVTYPNYPTHPQSIKYWDIKK